MKTRNATRQLSSDLIRLKSQGLALCKQELKGDEGIEINPRPLLDIEDSEAAAAHAAAAIIDAIKANKTTFAENDEAIKLTLLCRGLSDEDLTFAREIAAKLGGIVRSEDSPLAMCHSFVVATNRLGWTKPSSSNWKDALSKL